MHAEKSKPATKVVTGGNNSSPTLTLPNGKAVNPWLVLISLIIGLFMALLDGTIVNIAFTAIQTDLKTDATTTTWVLNAYSLVFAVLLVTMGRLADQFGRKKMFMIGMVMFSLGSLLCATAPTIEWLIAFRAIQAIGAATMNPISLAIITITFPPEKRGAAIGAWGALTGLAMGLGPVIGGVLVENFKWESIFFVNLPFCILGLLMVWRFVPESRDQNSPRSIDILGTVLLSGALLCLVLGIMNGNGWGWGSLGILSLFGGSALSMALFVVAELKQKHPIVDFKLFKIRSFMASNLALFLFGIGIQASMIIMVLYFIMAKGMDELTAAYALLPMSVAGFLVSGAFSGFSRKVNLTVVAVASLVISGVGMVLLFMLGDDPEYLDVAWRAIFTGMGLGLSFMTFSNIVLSEVPPSKAGVGSGVFNTFRQIGFALGVAVMMTFFTGQLKDNMSAASTRAVEIIKAETSIPQPVQTMILDQMKKMGGGAMSSGDRSTAMKFDLTAMLAKMPGGDAYKPQMAALDKKLNTEFQTAMQKSFRDTWLLGGLFILISCLPAVFAKHNRDGVPEPEPSGEQKNFIPARNT